MATAARPRSARPTRRPDLGARLAALAPLDVLKVDRLVRGIAPTFRQWNEAVTPAYRFDWPHLDLLQTTLDRVLAGELRKVIVTMPPRHGKSETGTIRFPVYGLVDDPTRRFIIAAYDATLAQRFSRKARQIARRAGVLLSEDRKAVDEWETTAGGGVRAAGVGGGITGHGANVILVDDPIKSRAEAESKTFREAVWNWYTDDLYTRREPGAAIVITMTRWHEDDLVGRLLANHAEDAHEWTHINLPAFAEEGDTLGRPIGAALCPERYDEAALLDIRRTQTEYAFSALFQGRPIPRGGGMLPPELATIVDAVPAHATRLRWWDMASTAGGGDWTAGVRLALADGVVYVEDVVHVQKDAAARDALVKQTAELDGRYVPQWREQEPGSSGKDAAGAFVRMLAGWPVHTRPASGDKVVRAEPFAAQWQAGNVRLVRGPWNRAFLDEAASFPAGQHDDQVDAAASAFNQLAGASAFDVPAFASSSSFSL